MLLPTEENRQKYSPRKPKQEKVKEKEEEKEEEIDDYEYVYRTDEELSALGKVHEKDDYEYYWMKCSLCAAHCDHVCDFIRQSNFPEEKVTFCKNGCNRSCKTRCKKDESPQEQEQLPDEGKLQEQEQPPHMETNLKKEDNFQFEEEEPLPSKT